MNIEEFRDYCIQKIGVSEGFPFDRDVLVFKVTGKIFALTSLKSWEEGVQSVNLKCDPDYALELRENYESIAPGFHMNKKHWNTLKIYMEELPYELLKQLITHSYEMVIKGLTKKQKELLLYNN